MYLIVVIITNNLNLYIINFTILIISHFFVNLITNLIQEFGAFLFKYKIQANILLIHLIMKIVKIRMLK